MEMERGGVERVNSNSICNENQIENYSIGFCLQRLEWPSESDWLASDSNWIGFDWTFSIFLGGLHKCILVVCPLGRRFFDDDDDKIYINKCAPKAG